MQQLEYDMVVLGAGIAGGTTALCLSRAGIKVLVVEVKTHPRFAIGESTTPLTTMDVLKLAKEWDLPELGNISSYLGMRAAGLVTYPKEIFWFGYNYEGQPTKLEHETIALTTLPPLGPDSHMLRADLDEYLTSLFPKYGIDYMDNTAVTDFITSEDADFVDLGLHSYGESGRDTKVRSRFVVDCTGHNCFLARRFGLHHADAHLRHRSRTIYSHFAKPPGWDLDKICGGRNPYIHTKRDNGTMHHMFEGGWIWVIPFDNDTVSVGIVLDLDMYPLDYSVSAQEEWDRIVAQFPTVHAHLSPLKPLRSLLRTGRMQITSESILGDRFILSPHAASFIDPLYSTGISLTMRFVRRLTRKAKEIISVRRSPEIPNPTTHIRAILQPLDDAFRLEVDQIDMLVSGTFDATVHPLIFRQFWRLWIIATLITVLLTKDSGTESIFCSFDPAFVLALTEAYKIVHDFSQRVKAANPEKGSGHKKMAVDEEEAVQIATQVKDIADRRLQAFHKKTLFDVMPSFPIGGLEPGIMPGGVASEYQMDFLLGNNRPRFLSLFLGIFEIVSIRVCLGLGKLLGTRFAYGSHLVQLFAPHVTEKRARRVTPFTMLKRIYYRLTNKDLV